MYLSGDVPLFTDPRKYEKSPLTRGIELFGLEKTTPIHAGENWDLIKGYVSAGRNAISSLFG